MHKAGFHVDFLYTDMYIFWLVHVNILRDSNSGIKTAEGIVEKGTKGKSGVLWVLALTYNQSTCINVKLSAGLILGLLHFTCLFFSATLNFVAVTTTVSYIMQIAKHIAAVYFCSCICFYSDAMCT